MHIDSLSINTNMYSLGSLLGGSTNQEILNQINRRAANFFGSAMDPLRDGFHNFMTKVVEPVRQASQAIGRITSNLFMSDEFRPITSIAELKRGIPPCMHKPIVYFAPIRNLLNEDRIDGFGIDPKTLEVDDPYEDMCNSGKIEFNSKDLDADGCIVRKIIHNSDDPDLTPEEVLALSDTRDFLAEFLEDEKTKHIDPTDYPRLHG